MATGPRPAAGPKRNRSALAAGAVGLAVLALSAACRAGSAAPASSAASRTFHAVTGPAGLRSSPLPRPTARKLPGGVFYLLAGPPPGTAWASVWSVRGGREELITRGNAGRLIRGFAASRRGMLASVFLAPYDELARWTRAGPVWLHPRGRPHTLINGLENAISPDGTLAYLNGGVPAAIWTKASWTGRDRLIEQIPKNSGGVQPAFGPGHRLALIGPYWTNLHGRPDVIIRASDGAGPIIRRLHTGFASLGYTAFWGPGAPALVIGSSADTFELLYLTGKRQMLPPGWRPLAWNPAGRRLLMFGHRRLGTWSPRSPEDVTVIGPVNRGYHIFQAAWLTTPAAGAQ